MIPFRVEILVEMFICSVGRCKKVFENGDECATHERTHDGDAERYERTPNAVTPRRPIVIAPRPPTCPPNGEIDVKPSVTPTTTAVDLPSKEERKGVPPVLTTLPSSSPTPTPAPLRRPSKQTVCRVCHKTFASLANLKAHQRTHEGTRICEECGETFNFNWQLERHSLTHNTVKSYSCAFCHKSLSTSKSRNRHQLVCKLKCEWVCE